MSEQEYEAKRSLEELENDLESAPESTPMQPAPQEPPAAQAQPAVLPPEPAAQQAPPAPQLTQTLTLPPLVSRPLPPPRKAQGKGWVTLWKVTAWLACILIIAGGTLLGLFYVDANYTLAFELMPMLVLAGFIVVSVVLGLSVLAGVMVVCGIFREMTALRHVTEQLRRRQ